MQPNVDTWDAELLELAEATERAAKLVGEPSIAARLRAMAEEVRGLAGGVPSPSSDCRLPA